MMSPSAVERVLVHGPTSVMSGFSCCLLTRACYKSTRVRWNNRNTDVSDVAELELNHSHRKYINEIIIRTKIYINRKTCYLASIRWGSRRDSARKYWVGTDLTFFRMLRGIESCSDEPVFKIYLELHAIIFV